MSAPPRDSSSGSTTAKSLLEVLLCPDKEASSAAQRLTEKDSWQNILNLVVDWKVAPQFLSRIEHLSKPLSAVENGALRRAFLKAYARSSSAMALGIAAAQELEKAGIPAVAFKGVAAIAFLYHDPRKRTIYDADLLISPSDLGASVQCLEAAGFLRQGAETLKEYLHFVANAPGFAGNQALVLHKAGGEVDLHWDVKGSGISVSSILSRAVRASVAEKDTPVASPEDCFLLTLHHSIRENLAIESVCRDLLDVQRWCGYFETRGELPEAMRHAVECGSAVPALAVTSILAKYDQAGAVAAAERILVERSSAVHRRSAQSLVELFEYQLSHGRLAKDVFYLVHSKPWRQIVKGLATDWSAYQKSMNNIEEHLEQEASIGERLSRLARSIPGLRELKLARELARIKYR